MQDVPKAVWSIPNISVALFPSLKHNFIAYRSSKVSTCIFEIDQLWQSGFSRVYSNFFCSCSFKPEIIKIGLSAHKMYRNNIVNFQESATILNACTKKSRKTYWIHHVYNVIYSTMWNAKASFLKSDHREHLKRRWQLSSERFLLSLSLSPLSLSIYIYLFMTSHIVV